MPRRVLPTAALLFAAACSPDTTLLPTTETGTTDTTGDPEDTSDTDDPSSTTDSSDTGDTGNDPTDTDDPQPTPACGDGQLDADEECDDGNAVDWDACSNACTLPACGDGMVQVGEICDLGPANGPASTCTRASQLHACGDGQLGPGESCDDGNRVDDDACPNDCVIPGCGNGILDRGEQCEDGNADPSDGCTDACLYPVCGDGIVHVGYEECDDGNPFDDDACSNTCELAACGDGRVQLDEECDDGNALANDGCNQCEIQRVVQISVGADFACAVLDTGALRCWGSNHNHALGYTYDSQPIGDDELPWAAGDVPVDGTVVEVSAGETHTCVRLDDATARCWGSGTADYGVLGYPGVTDVSLAAQAGPLDLGGPVIQLAAGFQRTCARLDTGAVRCWGDAQFGLGYSNTTNVGYYQSPADTGDIELGTTALQLAGSAYHDCAVTTAGNVRCWGYNGDGVLGYGIPQTASYATTPAMLGDVDLGPGEVQRLVTGPWQTCAIMVGGGLRCWGYVHGLGKIGDDEVPADVGDLDLDDVVVDYTGGTACRVDPEGAVRCWGGNNQEGSLGAGQYPIPNPWSAKDAPIVDVGDPIAAIDSYYSTVCALTQAGGVRCWGRNDLGQLGYGHTEDIGDDEVPAAAGYVQVFEP